MSTLDDLVALDLGELKREHQYLTAVHDWAIQNLGIDYTEGDRIEIIHPRPSSSKDGWYAYREALAVGQVGTAGEISYNQYAKRWQVYFRHERCWSVSSGEWGTDKTTRRYWSGPVDETPEGFQPPSKYDVEHYPQGRPQLFAFDVSWVRKATPTTAEHALTTTDHA